MVLRGFSEFSGALGVAWGPSGAPRGALGRASGTLGRSLSRFRAALGRLGASLGGPRGRSGASQVASEDLRGDLRRVILGSPSGDLGGVPGSHREASGGAKGDLKIIKKPLVFIVFSAVGAALRDLAAPLGSHSSSRA